MSDNWEIIVKVGGEGGSITLFGMKDKDDNWMYKKKVNEIYSNDVLNEEILDSEQLGKLDCQENIVYCWEDAWNLIKYYPLAMLVPMKVHEEFADKVFKEIIKDENLGYAPGGWTKACYPEGNEIARLALYIKRSRFTVVLTGAGMSTESGIPDFRSKDGWWKNIDPATVATTEALEENYDLFHDFYSMRLKGLESCKPHDGHKILAEWEKKGLVNCIATQNVDGLHIEAGSKRVYELHGSINTVSCDGCGSENSKADFINKRPCRKCGGKLRPDVVLFGENLPDESWNNALSGIMKAELVIVIGSSLQVYPVNKLPALTKGKVVYINNELSSSNKFDLTIKGRAKETLIKLDRILG